MPRAFAVAAQARQARAVEQARERVVRRGVLQVVVAALQASRRASASRATASRSRQAGDLFEQVAAQFEQVLRLPREQAQAFELLRA
jgi:hypothetical protein